MMDKCLVVLSQDADLKGKDLSLSYRHYKASKELPDNPAQFKKKEPLEAMAKSILKHRILTLWVYRYSLQFNLIEKQYKFCKSC